MDDAPKSEGRLQLREVNPYLICVLCGGYFVDAASIVECLHTFCWTCIVKYLEKNKHCPICDVQAYKTKPYLSIRPDYTIQRLTYKMVPGLFANEMARRREYYLNSEPPPTAGHMLTSSFFAPDDSISLSLEYYEAGTNNNNDEKCSLVREDEDIMKMKLVPHKRYLQCPAAVTINHLKKFVRMKYGLAAEQMVDIIYQEECLPEDFTLMDVAYTFIWDRTTPMRFSYRILERAAVPAQTKSDVNGAHGYSAPNSDSKKNNWTQNGPTSGSDGSTTNTTNGRQLRGHVFSKRKSDSGNESNDTSFKDEDDDEIDNLSLVKRLRVSARQTRSSEKGSSKPRRRSRSTSRKSGKRKKTDIEVETRSDYSAATSPDYPSLSVPSTNEEDSLDDDYAKYEDDIEEITDDFDDEDDEGRLRISPTEDEATEKESEEVTSQEGSVNNDGDETKTETNFLGNTSPYSFKPKKKSKKGKHHHHHKHHDRHAKKAPPALILKSSDTDIMKLKVKLNPVVSCEKYKFSSGKPKLIGEVIPMTNSNVSTTTGTTTISNNSIKNKNVNVGSTSSSNNESNKSKSVTITADKSSQNISSSSEISSSTGRSRNNSSNSTSKCNSTKSKDEPCFNLFNDSDSQNSQLSEENAKLNHAKNVINEDPECLIEEETQFEAGESKDVVMCSSEQKMKCLRAKPNFAVTTTTSRSNPPPLIFTSSDSNSSRSKSPLLHPPSSITVSKITAAEKRKLDEDKLLNNPDSKSADSLRPSLEIMLVNGPKPLSFFRDEMKVEPIKKKSDGPASSVPASSSPSVSITSSSSPSSAPSQSPLVRLQKMSINLPAVTLTHSANSSKCYTPKTVLHNGNEPRIQAGSIEISLQKENTAPKRTEERDPKRNEGQRKGPNGDGGVLDLSGKSVRPSIPGVTSVRTELSSSPSLKKTKIVSPANIQQQVSRVSSPSSTTSKSNCENGSKPLPVCVQNLTMLSNAAAHIENRLSQHSTKVMNGSTKASSNTTTSVSQQARSSPAPSVQTKSVNVTNNPSQQNTSLKIPNLQQRPMNNISGRTKPETLVPPRSKTMPMPKLNEIDRKQFIRSIPQTGGNGMATSRPGPNQFVRHITDPSVMIYARQQNAAAIAPISSSSMAPVVKKYTGVNNGRLSSPPAAIPIASMLRQGVLPRDIEKVSAGLQLKAAVNAGLASVK